MRRMFRMLTLFLATLLAAALMGCGDDDDGPMSTGGGDAASFHVTIKNLASVPEFAAAGVFDTPVAKTQAGPIVSGEAYEFTFGAAPGAYLSFATMLVQSNDLFYAPAGMGIALFDNMGNPNSGDVTDQVMLWDAGTEANEEPGVGANQPLRQLAADTGPADADNTVRLVDDGFTYPMVSDVVEVTLTHMGDNIFQVRIENVSDPLTTSEMQDVALPLAPGVFVVHTAADPIFTADAADRGEGLEALAEDGEAGGLFASIDAETGVATALAPGVYAVHASGAPLFTSGQADYGDGLEALAEDGDATGLGSALDGASGVSESGVFNTPVGASGPGPVLPGQSYSFDFDAEPGDRLSFATMFVESNDLFYAPAMNGMALFDGSDMPVTGDITSSIHLWDAGTEVNQWPGAGPDQPLRQSGANVGAADANNTVRMVNDGFDYPATGDRIEVTVTATQN